MAKPVKQYNQDNPLGSCCYYDENKNKAVCEDGITKIECREKNKNSKNRWNSRKCNKRIAMKDDLCCNTCGQGSKDADVVKKLSKIQKGKTQFRSRVDEGSIILSENPNIDCRNSAEERYRKELMLTAMNCRGTEICQQEARDVANYIRNISKEKCEVCANRNKENLISDLKSYYSCLCVLNQTKEQQLFDLFKENVCLCNSSEETFEETILSKELNKLILEWKSLDDKCKSILPEDGPTKLKEEITEGCCCHYVKKGRSEKNYNSEQLRRCLPMTKRDCKKVINYQTIWKDCKDSDCSKNCVAANKPAKCGSCDPTYSPTPVSTPRRSTPSAPSTPSTPSTPSAPSAPSAPSTPSYGGGY